jgi:trimethylamine--corrinoid protein Co-methyltransferase
VIPHPHRLLEQLGPQGCEAIHDAALRILEKAGLVVQSEEACRAARESGATVEERGRRVRFPARVVEKAVASAPRRFTLHGRDPGRTVEVGADALLVCPGYGSASVADARGTRRDATMADFRAFASMAWRSECIDITGGLLVEPLDIPQALRPLELTHALIECSDKPFFGSAAGAEGARESLALARIVFDDTQRRAVMLGLVNINSPLRLDEKMAGALLEYARAAQPVLLTPGIMMGVTAPVTASGAMAQALAELLGCVALIQAIRPGAPVMIGTGGFGSDLRTGGPGFGREASTPSSAEAPQPNGVLAMNRPGGFVEAPSCGLALGELSAAPVFGDFNGDGRPDLLVPQGRGCRLFRNDGGVLTTEPIWSSNPPAFTSSVALGDVNGDAKLDLGVFSKPLD